MPFNFTDMEQKFHYATVSEAIDQLKKQGYILDFNLIQNRFRAGEQEYVADEFEIVDLYRYEGASDPADVAGCGGERAEGPSASGYSHSGCC